jgi:UDP-GlcNAc:undecaprenyl-phosphate GlcNAc-1-phosphate transferase
MINTLLITLGSAFAAGVLLVPVARALAARWGLVDAPDGRRKMQQRPIPVAGGPAVFLAGLAAIGVALAIPGVVRERILEQHASLLGLLLASAIICGVGLADDCKTLRGRHKLFGQMIAVGCVLSSGTVVESVRLLNHDLHLGPLALPFTALWLLGAINALNLIDGMDGLLGSVGVIICLAMAALAYCSGNPATAAIACALAGALLAFLCFNFPPASIFLGDSGSMLVGLVVGTLAIRSSLKGPATVALAAPTALLAIPFFDTLAAIVRRKLTGRSIYTTDRGHIHHCLQRRGFSSRRVLLLVSGLCLLTVAGALASALLNNELLALIAALAVVCILVVGRLFGHAECVLVKERLIRLWVWLRHHDTDRRIHQLEVRLQGSTDWSDLWTSVTICARELGLRTVCLDVNMPALHEGYHARWDRYGTPSETAACWRAEFPLVANGQYVGRLDVTGDRRADPVGDSMAAVGRLAEEVEQALAALGVPVPPPPAREEGVATLPALANPAKV